jgi:hypothetical protein
MDTRRGFRCVGGLYGLCSQSVSAGELRRARREAL